jgi:hypothetical protein
LKEGLFKEFFSSHDKIILEEAEVVFYKSFKELYSQGENNIEKEAFILFV